MWITNYLDKVMVYAPKKIARQYYFYKTHRYFIKWNHVETLDEKLNYILVNKIDKNSVKYVDKYEVRKYIKNCGFEDILINTYGVWDDINEINISELPNQFILKTTHASGEKFYSICNNKEDYNWKTEKDKLNRALKEPFWKVGCEYQYKYIKPRIYAEELLNDGRGQRLYDYKLYCFNGKPYCVLVCSNREESLHLDYYDLNWNKLDAVPKKYSSTYNIDKPKGLDKMIEVSKVLSKPFDFSRIDFYDIEGKIYFGEITLTPANANLYYTNEKWQKIFGKMIKI